MRKLFLKVYLPLAVCAALTILVSIVAMLRIIPEQVRRYRDSASDLHGILMSRDFESASEIEAVADSLGLEVHVTRNVGQLGRVPPPEGFAALPGLPRTYPWRVGFNLAGGGAGGMVRRGVWVIIVVLLVVEGLVLYLALWPVRKRLGRLEWAAEQLGSGNLGVRLPSREGGDLIDSLGRTFNSMAARTDTLVGSHRELLGLVAHELRTPLARMRLALELVREDAGDGRSPKLDRMETDLDELDRLVSELLAYNRLGRRDEIERQMVDLSAIAREVSEAEGWARSDVSVEASGEGRVPADRELLGRAVANLVRNAVRHARSVVRVTVEGGDAPSVTVEDDGPGYDRAMMERLGKPFVKGPGGGTGLGLAIASRVAGLHGGGLELGRSGELGGARAVLKLG